MPGLLSLSYIYLIEYPYLQDPNLNLSNITDDLKKLVALKPFEAWTVLEVGVWVRDKVKLGE